MGMNAGLRQQRTEGGESPGIKDRKSLIQIPLILLHPLLFLMHILWSCLQYSCLWVSYLCFILSQLLCQSSTSELQKLLKWFSHWKKAYGRKVQSCCRTMHFLVQNAPSMETEPQRLFAQQNGLKLRCMESFFSWTNIGCLAESFKSFRLTWKISYWYLGAILLP